MAITYQYHKDKGYLLCNVDDKVTLNDALAYFDKIINDPEINNPFFEIVEFSNNTIFDFGYYQTNTLMTKINHLKSLNNYQGSLLIAYKTYLHGMVNVFKVVGEDHEINVKAFGKLDEAVNYVSEHFA